MQITLYAGISPVARCTSLSTDNGVTVDDVKSLGRNEPYIFTWSQVDNEIELDGANLSGEARINIPLFDSINRNLRAEPSPRSNSPCVTIYCATVHREKKKEKENKKKGGKKSLSPQKTSYYLRN